MDLDCGYYEWIGIDQSDIDEMQRRIDDDYRTIEDFDGDWNAYWRWRAWYHGKYPAAVFGERPGT